MKFKKISLLFVFVAFVMIGIGLWRGEELTVLNKGTNLCLECVGIG